MANEQEIDEVLALGDLLSRTVMDRMRLCTDFEKYLQSYRGRLLRHIQNMLQRHRAGIKIQVIVTAEYEKVLPNAPPSEPASGFTAVDNAATAEAAVAATIQMSSQACMLVSSSARAAALLI